MVIGGGRYGQIALKRLGSRAALVVEPDPAPELEGLGIPLWQTDGIEAARAMLASEHPPSYLIPTLPVHLLAVWLQKALADLGPRSLDIPADLLKGLDALQHPDHQVIYLSLADFMCPDDCSEPAEFCTVTGRPRGVPLFQRLRDLPLSGISLGIVRSHQLAPGVGGLNSSRMLELLNQVRDSGGRWLIATACRCHGVAHLVEFGRLASSIDQ